MKDRDPASERTPAPGTTAAGPACSRPARPTDYDTIAAVVDAWWGRPVLASLPRLFLDHFHASSRVVEYDDGLAAFLIGFRSPSRPDLAYIHFVGVRPDLRGRDLARSLYEDFFERARGDGVSWVEAVTSAANTGSIVFHLRLGFTVSAPRPDYNGPGRPMVVFRKRLDPATPVE